MTSSRGRGAAVVVVARSVGGDPAERRRRRMLGTAVAGCSAFLLSAVALAGVEGDVLTCIETPDGGSVCDRSPATTGLAPYVAESGLRVGVVLAAVLLVVPFAVLAVQVLRLGSAARERRLAAMRVQGATTADLRRVAAAEVRGAAARGAAAGLPLHLVLWLVLGVLAPPGWRLLPAPGFLVLAAWPVVVVLLVVAAVVAARAAAGTSAVDVLGLPRRRPRPLGRRAAVVAGGLTAALVAVTVLFAGGQLAPVQGPVVLALPVLFVAVAVAVGPWLVVAAGRRLLRRQDPVAVLAGRRLLNDPRTPGRVAGVLLAVGLAVGFAVTDSLGVLVAGRTTREDLVFFGGGILLALGGIGLAAVVAALSLVVGATEQVVDAHRPTAALVALGVPPETVRRVVRTQLLSASVLPAVTGALVGGALLGTFFLLDGSGPAWLRLAVPLVVLLAAAAAAAMAGAGAAGALRLLRRPLADATSVESLRTA